MFKKSKIAPATALSKKIQYQGIEPAPTSQ